MLDLQQPVIFSAYVVATQLSMELRGDPATVPRIIISLIRWFYDLTPVRGDRGPVGSREGTLIRGLKPPHLLPTKVWGTEYIYPFRGIILQEAPLPNFYNFSYGSTLHILIAKLNHISVKNRQQPRWDSFQPRNISMYPQRISCPGPSMSPNTIKMSL